MPIRTQRIHKPIRVALGTATPDPLAPPAWACELAAAAGNFALTTAGIADAVSLGAEELEAAVVGAYDSIAQRIGDLPARHPVRLWNHIPDIHGRMDDQRDRYMVFNAGRYRAYATWYGGPHAFDSEVATASGVGHNGTDLVVHCLSAREPGVAVDNPRQVAPHRYSARFGPLPPCFARATVLPGEQMVLVGGTASIRGEDSRHRKSLALQFRETLTNLSRVVQAAHGRTGDQDCLSKFRELRVYHPRSSDRKEIERWLTTGFARDCRVEIAVADLCRQELLVEIEGVAVMGGRS
ncbi:MAG TPA: hypothetical protein VH475_19385 [Tepidisphaeraceae bacterium]|jgi:hypothetical protein